MALILLVEDEKLLRWAIDGAHEWLGEPACQEVLSDFRDLSGKLLADVLAEIADEVRGDTTTTVTATDAEGDAESSAATDGATATDTVFVELSSGAEQRGFGIGNQGAEVGQRTHAHENQ